jgi:hypothetical protein
MLTLIKSLPEVLETSVEYQIDKWEEKTASNGNPYILLEVSPANDPFATTRERIVLNYNNDDTSIEKKDAMLEKLETGKLKSLHAALFVCNAPAHNRQSFIDGMPTGEWIQREGNLATFTTVSLLIRTVAVTKGNVRRFELPARTDPEAQITRLWERNINDGNYELVETAEDADLFEGAEQGIEEPPAPQKPTNQQPQRPGNQQQRR